MCTKKTKYSGNAKCVECQPTHRKDRVITWRRGHWSLCHGFFQANVELSFSFVALANDGSFGVCGLEVSIRTRGPKGVVGQACVDEKETGKEDPDADDEEKVARDKAKKKS